jgi:pimeloyl-ACP methyl ester carboxylesterase
MTPEPKAIHFLVQGKIFAAELYGEDGKTPVIALHGWLDNCHSFRPLAAHLENIQLLALDMAGHGHSEGRSADASYHIWDDVREVLMIANDMGWDRFVLLGHSRGAIIAALVAAVAPERVSCLLLIEGIWPQTATAQESPEQLAKFVHRYLSYDGVEKGYSNRELMIRARQRAGFGLGEKAATQIVERNIEYRDGYFYWLTDARLTMPSPVMLTVEQAECFIKAIQCPTLLLVASEGLGKNLDYLRPKIASNSAISVMILEGGHHMHMEETVVKVAQPLNDFLKFVPGV